MEEKPTVAANGFPILYDKTMMSYWVLDKIRDAWKHISQKNNLLCCAPVSHEKINHPFGAECVNCVLGTNMHYL